MTIKDANKKHYFSIVEPTEVSSVFENCAKEALTIYLWCQGQKEDQLEEFELYEYVSDQNTISMKVKGGFLSKLGKSKLTDKEVYLKINYNKFQYFSYSTLKYDSETKNYSLKVNNDVYRSQQRSNYRLNAGPFVAVQFKINDKVYDGHDISAGGTSFTVTEEEVKDLPEGTIFDDCMLRLNRDKFSIPQAKIAKTWPDKDRDGELTGNFKVGVAFIDVPKHTEEELFKSINGEARAEEIRKNLKSKKAAGQ
ncbi:PilZ domain-containing protein [Halobacteriovorax sp. HLS]|uniref:PilZ domain-containing protein n=1 Tax=Halobacteriovorax sp. HLS TaxID=2234000 RepID=UPI000FDB9C1F|nr:PilZ domain-containing protein [Halobacteriovorax sp. HLS]